MGLSASIFPEFLDRGTRYLETPRFALTAVLYVETVRDTGIGYPGPNCFGRAENLHPQVLAPEIRPDLIIHAPGEPQSTMALPGREYRKPRRNAIPMRSHFYNKPIPLMRGDPVFLVCLCVCGFFLIAQDGMAVRAVGKSLVLFPNGT